MAATNEEYIYVVSDCHGFVCAYKTLSEANDFKARFFLNHFLLQRFVLAPGQSDVVWVVLYRDIDAVLYVSNNMEDAEHVRVMYEQIGFTYADSVHWWEHRIGEINQIILDRIKTMHQAHEDFILGVDNSVPPPPQKFRESPLVKLLRENKTVSLMECVIDTVADTVADTADMVAGAEASADMVEETADTVEETAEVSSDWSNVKSDVKWI